MIRPGYRGLGFDLRRRPTGDMDPPLPRLPPPSVLSNLSFGRRLIKFGDGVHRPRLDADWFYLDMISAGPITRPVSLSFLPSNSLPS